MLPGSDQAQQATQAIRPPAETHPNAQTSELSSNVSSTRLLPPTPPPRPTSGFDSSNQSPTSMTSQQYFPTQAAGFYNASAINNVEPHAQRQMTYPPMPQKHQSLVSQGHSLFGGSPYGSPGAISNPSYGVSPIDSSPSSAIWNQRPLPGNFPPVAFTPSSQPIMPYGHPTWQHHHHFPPSASAPYPQSPDRYICQTCSKAFSRPSSLKIHSHSHTGEKPYKCPHAGCGKAFSVRSNMKRHEKGCHGDSGSLRDLSPGSM